MDSPNHSQIWYFKRRQKASIPKMCSLRSPFFFCGAFCQPSFALFFSSLFFFCGSFAVTLPSRRSHRRHSPPATRSLSLRVRSGPASRCRYTRSLFLPTVQSRKHKVGELQVWEVMRSLKGFLNIFQGHKCSLIMFQEFQAFICPLFISIQTLLGICRGPDQRQCERWT